MSAGMVTQQEIPRTLDRNPAKSFYTWHVDRESCYTVLLSQLYESLVNLHVRREAELLEQHALLARAERKDVRENLSMLEKGDREELKTLEWKLESIGVAMERIDRDIFVLETLPNLSDMPDPRDLPDKPKRQ
jgi:DNA-directed RNA polymerase III subunit RPC3